MVKENFTEKGTSKEDLKEVSEMSHAYFWGTAFLAEGVTSAKSSSQECAWFFRKNKEPGVTGEKR